MQRSAGERPQTKLMLTKQQQKKGAAHLSSAGHVGCAGLMGGGGGDAAADLAVTGGRAASTLSKRLEDMEVRVHASLCTV